jgi:hypothetical protein
MPSGVYDRKKKLSDEELKAKKKVQQEAYKSRIKDILAEMRNGSAEQRKAGRTAAAIEAKKLEAEAKKLEAEAEKRLSNLTAKHEKKMAEMVKKHNEWLDESRKKEAERADRISRNSWNRRFLGLNKYGHAIHPRYMKNMKKEEERKKRKQIAPAFGIVPTLPKKKSSNKKKLGIIFGVFILFYFIFKIFNVN